MLTNQCTEDDLLLVLEDLLLGDQLLEDLLLGDLLLEGLLLEGQLLEGQLLEERLPEGQLLEDRLPEGQLQVLDGPSARESKDNKAEGQHGTGVLEDVMEVDEVLMEIIITLIIYP
jgi:hypothetical protein